MSEARVKLDRALSRLAAARDSVTRERSAMEAARRREADAREALECAQAAAQFAQEQAHSRIADLATRCLRAVFDDPYEVRIKFERKRNRTEAVLCLCRDGMELEDPQDEAGGACLEIAAFALRLAVLLLASPPRRRLLVLDEPFGAVHKSRQPAVRALLEALAAEVGVQILMVTHDDGLRAGEVIEL